MVLQSWWKINRWLVIGVLALAIAVYATLQVLALRPQQAVPNTQTVPVMVVAKPIAPDTQILPADLVQKAYPVSLVPPGAYTGSLAGEWSTEALSPGEVLVASDVFAPASSDQIKARLPKGDVAYDLSLSAQAEVDGVIAPGDRITLFTSLAGGTAGTGGDRRHPGVPGTCQCAGGQWLFGFPQHAGSRRAANSRRHAPAG